MHYSTLFFAPALLSLLVTSSPIPKEGASNLNTYDETTELDASSDFWKKIDRRAAAPTTTATITSAPTPSTTAADPTSPTDTTSLYSDPDDAAIDDSVWIPDEVFPPPFDKRSVTVNSPAATVDDYDYDDDFIYLYDPKASAHNTVTGPGANSTEVGNK